ncbi:MAG: sugar transferase, partial [Desulfobulbaceae bacterium]|nr:sugar transferase [Desulfobulbaceae bacterium]
MIPNKLEKAIILSGSPGTAIFPLANYYPNFLFPIANEVLLKYMLHSLRKSGIMEVAIVSSANEKRLQAIISTLKRQENGLQIHHLEQRVSRGTAGSLKQLKDFIAASPFLVLGANLFIDELPLEKILAFHLAHGYGGTMVAEQISGLMEQLENIEFSKDGAVNKVHVLHHSKDLRRHLKPSGIYVFNPCVLDYIFEKGYMDIKEQLIPLLSSNNIQIHAYTLDAPPWKINSLADYLELNRKVLFQKKQQICAVDQPRSESLQGVWFGRNARIAPSAYLLGPIVIGDDCVIEEYAQIIGPTSIGSGTRIDADVLVRESIVWNDSHLQKSSSVEYSLISEGVVVSVNENIRNVVVVNDRQYPGSLNMLSLTRSAGKRFINRNGQAFPFPFYKSARYYAFRAFKRGVDLLFSGVTLILSLPLFILIALAIKMDSPGPVFFCQKRCGMEGKEFNMYKFRTMGQGAEAIQDQL